MVRPFMSKKIVLSFQGEQNRFENPMDEIWSVDIDNYPMNRTLNVNIHKVRKIKSEWREFMFGDKFFSSLTFFDENGHVIDRMASHPGYLTMPYMFTTNEIVVEETLKPTETIIGI